jgi:hypothetical protein
MGLWRAHATKVDFDEVAFAARQSSDNARDVLANISNSAINDDNAGSAFTASVPEAFK